MKYIVYASFILLFPLFLYSQQSTYPCHFLILDAKNHKPISGASVSIDQIGGGTTTTDINGRCEFKNVPVGRIDYNISHTNYRFLRKQETISSEVKNNSFVIDLIPNSDDTFSLYGRVENDANHEIDQVKVEAVVDGIPYRTTTDETGNYKFEIPLTNNRSDRVKIEFTKGSCRLADEVSVPTTHYLEKSVKIQCMRPSTAGSAASQSDQRSLTEDDKRQLRQQMPNVSNQVFVQYQRTDKEAERYATEIYEYVKSLGFSGNTRYGTVPGRGRFVIKEDSNLRRPTYLVNVCARELN